MAEAGAPGVHGAWSLYRQCAATSAFHKAQLARFTGLSLWLGMAGAAVGTAGQFVGLNSTASKIIGVVGSLCVALAGVTAMYATSGGRDKISVRCRGAGEALKSAVFLYSAGVAPYEGGTRASALGQMAEKALKDLEGVELRPARTNDTPPPGVLTAADYIRSRVDDQIGFYTKAANKFHKKADFWRLLGLGGAAVGAALSAISAVYSLAPWVALLATVTTSFTAFVKSQRYESMIALYQASAIRLQLLKDQWADSGKTETDKAARDAFIQGCEDTMALESGAWVAQWLQEPANAQAARVGAPGVSTSGHDTVHAGEGDR